MARPQFASFTSPQFAEGDSRVLMQKMARDRMRLHAKESKAGKAGKADAPGVAANQSDEQRLCAVLAQPVESGVKPL